MQNLKELASSMKFLEFIQPDFIRTAIQRAQVTDVNADLVARFGWNLRGYYESDNPPTKFKAGGSVQEFVEQHTAKECRHVPNVGKVMVSAFEKYLLIFSLTLRGSRMPLPLTRSYQ